MGKNEGLTEVTIWYRGVIEGRLARRIGNCLADAARSEGEYVQAFDNYVDLPDRVNVPCRFYARVSGQPIAEPYLYENYTPSVVITTDAALVKGCNVLKGIVNGSTLLVNTKRSPEFVLGLVEGLPEVARLKRVATVDAGVAHEYRVPYGGVEGASEKAVSLKSAAIILGALNQVNQLVRWESLNKLEPDEESLMFGARTVASLVAPGFKPGVDDEVAAEPHTYRGKVNLVVPAPSPDGVQPGFITGNFRLERPVIDEKRCTRCRICWSACPDACITLGGQSGEEISFNLEYCKGCGICWYICPSKAISAEDELDHDGGMVRV
jgi:oxalate oxidoreductase subunit delta